MDDNNVGCAVTSATFSDPNVGPDKTVTAGVALTGTSAADYMLASPVTTTADITTLPITVTATTSTKVYDGNTSSTGMPTITSTTTLATVDTATYSQVFNSKDVLDATSLIPSISIDGGNSNYNITYVDATGSITSATATVTASGTDKVYDGTTAATVDLKVNGVIGSDDVTATGTATFDTKDFGTSKIVTVNDITLKGTDAGNYSLGSETSTTTTADITQASSTITANDAIKTYGQALTFNGTEFTVIGMLGSDNVSSVTLTSGGEASTSPVSGSPYSIIPSDAQGTGLTNYTITYDNGNLTVSQETASRIYYQPGKSL